MSNSKYTVLFVVLVFVFGCTAQQKLSKTEITKSFEEFSNRFYTDSLFQMSRIKFPLKGFHNVEVPFTSKNAVGDSIINGWEMKDWSMLTNMYFPNNETKAVIDGITYLRKIQLKGNTVTIKTYIEDSGFCDTEKFALQKGKWYLVNFSSMNY